MTLRYQPLPLLALLAAAAIGYAAPSLVNAQLSEAMIRFNTLAVQQHTTVSADAQVTGLANALEKEPHGDYLSSLPCIFCSDQNGKTTDASASSTTATEVSLEKPVNGM